MYDVRLVLSALLARLRLFFLGINPKLTLRYVLKKKIDDIYTWLDLDDDDMKALTKPISDTTSTLSKVIFIPAYDIYQEQETKGS